MRGIFHSCFFLATKGGGREEKHFKKRSEKEQKKKGEEGREGITATLCKSRKGRTFSSRILDFFISECATNFYPLLNLTPFFLLLFLSSNDKKQKSVVNKAETQKVRIKEPWPFWVIFWAIKMGILNLIRALMYWPKPVPVKEKRRKRQKKRN